MDYRRLFAVFVASLVSSTAHAAVYYVSPSGSDSNPGTSARPFKTIQRAADRTYPGDTVVVKNGWYENRASNRIVKISRSGRPGEWITYRAETRGGAILNGAGVTGYGFLFDNGVSNIRIQGFEIKNMTRGGIWANGTPGTRHVLISENWIHHNGTPQAACTDGLGRAGIFMNAHSAYFNIEKNLIHDNGRTPNPACASLPREQNHEHLHDHGVYAQGRYHIIRGNSFSNHRAGYHVKVDGNYGGIDRSKEFSHQVVGNLFDPNTNPDPRACGTVMMWNNRTYSSQYGTMSDPRLLLDDNYFERPRGAYSAYDTGVCIGGTQYSSGYGGHRMTRNTTTSRYLYNENQPWVSRLSIVAYDNRTGVAP